MLKQALPPPYPFAHVIKDAAKPKVERVRIGGARENLGEAVPHHFLSILSDGEPYAFEKGAEGWSWPKPSRMRGIP